jgi:hypothetical protein
VLADLDHLLKVGDRIVRFVILRRSAFQALLNTDRAARMAARLLHSGRPA